MSKISEHQYKIALCELLASELDRGAGKEPFLAEQISASSDTLNIIREYLRHDAELSDGWRMVDYLKQTGMNNLAEQISPHLPTRETG